VTSLTSFLTALAQHLAAAAATSPFGAQLRTSADLLSSLRPRAAVPAEPSCELEVCAYLDEALRARSPLADAVAELVGELVWMQNPNYQRVPPAPGFLANYGFAAIVDREGGAPALGHDDAMAVGLVLLGPRTAYPPHHHPALEDYVALTEADWWAERVGWRPQEVGSVLHHGSFVQHAMRTGEAPLLAIYVWRGDSSFTPSMWAK
jgi:hypothetical protein